MIGIVTDNKSVDTQKIFHQNSELLIQIINVSRKCKYLKQLGISSSFDSYYDANEKFDYSRMNEFVHEFRNSVPISEYQNYRELIDLIYSQGRSDVILPGLPNFFCLSSGTDSGKLKMLPWFYSLDSYSILDQMKKFPNESTVKFVNLAGFSKFNKNSKGINIITKSITHFSPINALPFCSVSSASPRMENDIEPEFSKYETDYRTRILNSLVFSAACSDLEFISSALLTTVLDFFTFFEQEFETVMNHLENGTLPSTKKLDNDNVFHNIKKLTEINFKPDKKRADELRKIVLEDSNVNLKDKISLIWPNLTLVYSVYSGSFEPNLNICKKYCRNVLYANANYISSEGFHAVGLPFGSNHYCITPPANSFLEFLPEKSTDTVLPSELEVGKVYETLITSSVTGLLRYKLGDLVKVLGWYANMPIFSILGKKNLSLRALSYEINESDFISCFRQLDLNVH